MRPKLPSKIGAEVELLIDSPEVLRWLNWNGFEVSHGDHASWRLRRWSKPGLLRREPEPRCPAGAGRVIIAA
jgi:hypothetical protein